MHVAERNQGVDRVRPGASKVWLPGPTPAWSRLRPHPIQARLWTTRSRFVFVTAGRGSGKTELAKRRLVRFLPVRKPWDDPLYFYGAPTQAQAKRIAWNSFVKLIPKDWITAAYQGETPRIVTRFGSELWIVGLDAPQRIEGKQYDGCVIDESSDIKPGTFDLSIFPALAHRAGWCWRIGVPKRFGIGAVEYREKFEAAQRGELADAEAFTWPSSDILPPAVVADAMQRLDPRDFNEQFGGNWESSGGSVFYAFDDRWNCRPCAYRPEKTLIIGSDFNVDPMAWVVCHAWPDRLEVIDELFMRNANTAAALDALWKRWGHHEGGFAFFGDATGDSRHTSASVTDYVQIANDERFKARGRTVHYPKGNPPIKDRIASCNALMCNAAGDRRFFIDEVRCPNLKRDFKLRAYRGGTREIDDHGDVGHISDAVGYVVQRLFPVKIDVGGSDRQEVTTTGAEVIAE